jgi:hypothetical protein
MAVHNPRTKKRRATRPMHVALVAGAPELPDDLRQLRVRARRVDERRLLDVPRQLRRRHPRLHRVRPAQTRAGCRRDALRLHSLARNTLVAGWHVLIASSSMLSEGVQVNVSVRSRKWMGLVPSSWRGCATPETRRGGTASFRSQWGSPEARFRPAPNVSVSRGGAGTAMLSTGGGRGTRSA